MGECPASEMLQGLLDQSLPEALQKEIESHVEHCPGCAEILENLTKGVGGVLFPLAACIRPDQLHSEPVPPTSLPSIQNYEIRAELGRGGMAVVYKAWHVPLKRTVALKMILGAGHLDPERRARFRTEAESVARLQHPNIVQIFDIGEHAGRPFLALEFVEGGSLAKKLAGQPQPVQETAKTVETLARAIHHAHQKGVIHRDLKPANVLVNTDGRQMITDFGLAQAADEPARLRDGTIIGTAEYMAPEQAAGQFSSVGPSTDVYALGVILYEMLVGRPPFRGQTPPDTLEQVQTLDPVPPRHQQPKVPRDLETICLKCLEKEPHRRYGTAEALADDLDLFRSGKPIQARPTGPLTRSWKWCKRNPSGALAILSLVVGFLVSAVLAGIAWEQATVAKQQKAKAVRNAFLRLVTLNDVLEIAAGERLRRSGHVRLQHEILERLIPRFDEVLGLEDKDDATLEQQGLAWNSLTLIRRALNKDHDAAAATARAESIFRDLANRPLVSPSTQLGLASSLSHSGALQGLAGNYDDAIRRLQEANTLLSGLLDEGKEDAKLRYQLALVQNNWANCLMRKEQGANAETHYRAAIAHIAAAVRADPAEILFRDWHARTLSNLALLCMQHGQPDEANNLSQKAVDIARRLTLDFAGELDGRECLAVCLTNEAERLLQGGDHVGSLLLYREALSLYEGLARQVPVYVEFRWGRAMAESNVGAALAAGPAENWGQAEKHFHEADRLYQDLRKGNPGNRELQVYIEENRNRLRQLEQKRPVQP